MAGGPARGRAGGSMGSEGLDLAFVRRVLRTTTVVALLLAWGIYCWYGVRVSAGFLAGAALGLASLASIEWIVRRCARPGGPGSRPVGLLALAKLPLMAAAVWLLVWASHGSLAVLGAAAGGVSLLPVVIVLKIAGRWLIDQPLPGDRRRKIG